MNRVTRERVEELIEIGTENLGKFDQENIVRMQEDVLAALTRLLALEDALARARPVIEQYVRQLLEDNDGNYVWLQWRDDATKALEALAALGGDK